METYCVLVVDEDDVLRRIVTGFLQTEGYRVLSSRSVREAQDLMEVFQVDAVLVDAGYRYRQGPALLLDVQGRGKPIARLLLIKSEQIPEGVKAMGVGVAHGLVLKPVLRQDLLETVGRMLSMYYPDDEILRPRQATAVPVYDLTAVG